MPGNKPAAQAVGADGSQCNFTNRPTFGQSDNIAVIFEAVEQFKDSLGFRMT